MSAVGGIANAIVPGAGIALDVAGAVMGFAGASGQNEARSQMISTQQQDVALQQKMMQLQYQRQQRQMVRQSIIANAQAKSTANAQGALQSSVTSGAEGSVSGATGNNMLSLDQNMAGAQEKFGIENSMLNAYRTAAAGSSLSATGAGLSSLGGSLVKNQKEITNIGSDIMSMFGKAGE